MTEPEEFTTLKGTTIPRKISVDYVSFSAHVDFSQNSEFIELVKAQHVVRLESSVQPCALNNVSTSHFRFWFMASRQRWADYVEL